VTMLDRVGDVLLELHRGCRKQAAETFPGWAMALVREVIPNSAWLWGSGCVMDGEIIVHNFLFDNIPLESMQAWEQYKHLDIFAARAAEQRNVVHNFTHETLEKTEIYQQVYRLVGIEQMLGVYAYKPYCGLSDSISLYRSDPEMPFSEEQRLAMQCLVPHLIETRHINYLEHLSSGMQRPPQPSLAASDCKGVIHVAEEGFVELLRLEWPQWCGPRLPELLSNGRPAQRYAGKAITVRFVPVFDMFLLKARPRTAVDGLSKRELEVAKQLAKGTNHKEVALNLAIAPATARNHIASIHAKLGTSKGTQVATMLLSEGWL